MNKRRILQSLAAVLVLAGVLVVFIIPQFGIFFPVLVAFTMVVLLIVSAFYLGFSPDIEEDEDHKRKIRKFEKAGIVIIIADGILRFFWPKTPFLLAPVVIVAFYWFFLWGPAARGKGNSGEQGQSAANNEKK